MAARGSSALQTAKHLLAPLTSNCRDFHEQWNATSDPPDPESASGRWEGEWVSEKTGHRGPLRSVILAISSDRWRARFHARYSRFFRACYETNLETTRVAAGRYTFKGSSDLGWAAGGVYEYDGEATATELVCRYRSRFDDGEFRLKRLRAQA